MGAEYPDLVFPFPSTIVNDRHMTPLECLNIHGAQPEVSMARGQESFGHRSPGEYSAGLDFIFSFLGV